MSHLFKLLEPDFVFNDARGMLAQLVHDGYEQINVLVSHAGVMRGGHYHKHSQEAFYVVSGSVTMVFQKGNQQEERTFHEGEFFLIYPHVVHQMSFPENCILIGMYDHCVEIGDGQKDIFINEP